MKAVKIEMTGEQAELVRKTINVLSFKARIQEDFAREVLYGGMATILAILTDDDKWVCDCKDDDCMARKRLVGLRKEFKEYLLGTGRVSSLLKESGLID